MGYVAAERTALYRLFNDAEQLLYVGVTSRLEKRWKFHRRDKAWWPEVRIREIEWFSDRLEALRREAAEIAERRPRYNLNGGYQYLLGPVSLPAARAYLPTRGTTKLVAPSEAQLHQLEEAVQCIRDEERRVRRSPDQSMADLPGREERVLIRRAFGLSQGGMHGVLGVSTTKFQQWELGKLEPRGWDRLAYLKALEIMYAAVQGAPGQRLNRQD